MNKLLLTLGTAAVAAILAGCGGQPAMVPAQVTQIAPPAQFAMPDAAPPACSGQKTTKDDASVTEKLLTKPGYACIPLFGGLGGTLAYPGMAASVKATLISSTTNYAKLPLPKGSGSPMFYLNLTPSAHTSFGSDLKAGGGLTGKAIKARQTYTAYLTGYRYGFWYVITSCYSVAKAGTDGGVLGGLGWLLENQTIGGPNGHTEFEIFIYAGSYGGSKC